MSDIKQKLFTYITSANVLTPILESYPKEEQENINKTLDKICEFIKTEIDLAIAEERAKIIKDNLKGERNRIIEIIREEERERIVEYLKKNLSVGESYERGDVYLKIGKRETTGSGSFDWDDDFWLGVLKDIANTK